MKIEVLDEKSPPLITSTEEEPGLTTLNQLLNAKPLEMSSLQHSISVFMQACAIGVGAFSGIPYIAPAMDFAGEHQIWGYFLAYGIVTSLGVVEAWALLDIVSSLTSKTPKEKALSEVNYSIIKEILYWITTISLAMAAAYSVATLIYEFNDGSLFFFLVSMFTDIITNTASLNHFYHDTQYELRRYCSSPAIQAIETKRRTLLHKLNKSIDKLPTLPADEVRELMQAKQSGELKQFFTLFLDLNQHTLAIEQEHRFWFHGLPKKASKVVSTVFPLAWTVFGLINSYNSFSALISNELLNWIISTATNFPYLFLELTLASSLVNHVYNTLTERYFGTYNAGIPQLFYPKFYTLTLMMGLFTTANAFGARASFVTSTISGDAGIFLAIVVCISTVAYKSAAMMDIIKMSFEHFIKKNGNDEAKDLVALSHAMQHFSGTLKDANALKLEPLLDELDELLDESSSEVVAVAEQRKLSIPRQTNYASFWHHRSPEQDDVRQQPTSRLCAIL